MDPDRDLLGPSPRRPDQADPAAPDRIGKAKRHTVDDGSPAVGSHHEQALVHGQLFQAQLVLHGHIVGKEHDMEPFIQGVFRFPGRVLAGNRDLHQIGARQVVEGGAKRRRLVVTRMRFLFAVQLLLKRGDQVLHGHPGLIEFGRDEKIVGRHLLEFGHKHIQHFYQIQIQVGAHADKNLLHPLQFFHLTRDQHEGDGIVIGIFPDNGFYHEFTPLSCHCGQQACRLSLT